MISRLFTNTVKFQLFRPLTCTNLPHLNVVNSHYSTSESATADAEIDSRSAAYKSRLNDFRRTFCTPDLEEILLSFPPKLLNRKHNFPESIYIAHPKAADIIAEHLLKNHNRDTTLVEVNPGLGLLSQKLVESNVEDIRLFEGTRDLFPSLQEKFKDNSNVTIQTGDMMNVFRMAYMDRVDNGNRQEAFLSGLPQTEWTGDVNFRMFGCVGSVMFFKHLILSIVFQNSIMSLGRPEMNFIMPPFLYTHLTCSNKAGYSIYRWTTILFQIFFTHELVAKIPREYFIPYQHNVLGKKRVAKKLLDDPDHVYLVKIVPRRDLFDYVPADQLQALWYFVKQNCISRNNRIIPNLEKWVPGAGVHLILNTNRPPDINPLTNHSLDATPPNCAISNRSYFDKIDIFTTFGDLTPSQMLTLFLQFIHMPGYDRSPFLAAMETSLMRMEVTAEVIEGAFNEKEPLLDSFPKPEDSATDANKV